MKGWKTVLFGLLVAVLAVLSNAEMQEFIAENVPEVGGVLGAAIIILRALTTSPVFRKGEDD